MREASVSLSTHTHIRHMGTLHHLRPSVRSLLSRNHRKRSSGVDRLLVESSRHPRSLTTRRRRSESYRLRTSLKRLRTGRIRQWSTSIRRLHRLQWGGLRLHRLPDSRHELRLRALKWLKLLSKGVRDHRFTTMPYG